MAESRFWDALKGGIEANEKHGATGWDAAKRNATIPEAMQSVRRAAFEARKTCG